MIIVSLTNPPRSLRGDLSKWLMEINTNVFVGDVNARVRETLWDRITDSIKTGQATMVYSTNNEQGFDFKIWGSNWIPVDFDGLLLVQKPFPKTMSGTEKQTEYKSKYSRYRGKQISKNLSPINSDEVLEDLFAVIDLETTGLDPRKDDILEIGIVIANNSEIKRTKSILIKCNTPIKDEIENLTGITEADVQSIGIELGTALKELSDLTEGLTAIFHNSRFDLKFLTKSYKEAGLKMPKWLIQDTLLLAKSKLKGLNDYQLKTVCEELKCKYLPSHRAVDDCLATREVFIKLKNL